MNNPIPLIFHVPIKQQLWGIVTIDTYLGPSRGYLYEGIGVSILHYFMFISHSQTTPTADHPVVNFYVNVFLL